MREVEGGSQSSGKACKVGLKTLRAVADQPTNQPTQWPTANSRRLSEEIEAQEEAGNAAGAAALHKAKRTELVKKMRAIQQASLARREAQQAKADGGKGGAGRKGNKGPPPLLMSRGEVRGWLPLVACLRVGWGWVGVVLWSLGCAGAAGGVPWRSCTTCL